MKPTSRKMIRGFMWAIFMGIVSLTVIVEGDWEAVIMGLAYVLGALLVFGIDIRTIEYGRFRIVFESDERSEYPDNDDD